MSSDWPKYRAYLVDLLSLSSPTLIEGILRYLPYTLKFTALSALTRFPKRYSLGASFGYTPVMSKKSKAKSGSPTIALNKKARHDFFLEDKLEAGLALTGWEVKSLRAGKVQLLDSYVTFHRGEAWLSGALITPLSQASTHVIAEPRRERKLLMHRRELDRIMQKSQSKGYTCVCTALYWKGQHVKAEVALAKGKQAHDKRAASKDKDWAKEKERLMKHSVR